MQYISSYYTATANQHAPFPALDTTIECDTCIIGGGYAGLATALGLAERGVKNIVLIEKHRIAWGASGRNGGFVFGGYSLGAAKLASQIGVDKAKQLYHLTQTAIQVIRQRIKENAIKCDAVEAGVMLANWFDDERVLERLRTFMHAQLGVDLQPISRSQLQDEILSQRYHGGLFEKNAFHFHPLNYALGIAEICKKLGVSLYEDSPAVKIRSTPAEKLIYTRDGTIRARRIVVACGGYIDGLHKKLSNAVLPIATYVMATEPLRERLETALTKPYGILDTRFAFDYYRPLKDGRILWGGRISTKTKTPPQLQHLLYKDMLKVFPQLEGCSIEYCWSGLMSYARHEMPQIGLLSENVWYAMGFGGHGVAPTTVAGEIIASAIAENNDQHQLFKDYGIPPTWGFAGKAAAQLSYWYYQMRDWLRE